MEQIDAKWMMNFVNKLFAQSTVRRGTTSRTDLRQDFVGVAELCDARGFGRRAVGTITVWPEDGVTRSAATAVTKVAVAAELAP